MSDIYNKDVRAIVKPETTVFLSPPVGKPGRMGAIQLLLKAGDKAEGSYEFTLLQNLEQDTVDLIGCVGLVIEAPDGSCANLGDIVVITGKRVKYLLATGIAGSIRGLQGRTGAIQFLLEYIAVYDNKQYFNILKSFDPNFKAADIQQVCGLVIKKTAVDDSIKVGDIVAFTGIGLAGPYITIGASAGGVLGNILGDTFNDLLDRVAANEQRIHANEQEIISHTRDINENSKEISNIYTILGETIIGTEEVVGAYSMRQTAKGLPDLIDGALTKVTEIKGSTVRCENLIPFPYYNSSKTMSGVTFTINNDRSVTISGKPTIETGIMDFHLMFKAQLPVGTYCLSGSLNGSGVYTHRVFAHISRADGSTPFYGEGVFTINKGDIVESISIRIGYQYTGEELTYYPMLNYGKIALPYQPYQPYFTDLKSASISGIKSTGRNLFPYPYTETTKTMNGITFTDNGDGSITINGQNNGIGNSAFHLIANSVLQAGTYKGSVGYTGINLIVYDEDNTYSEVVHTAYTIDSQKNIKSIYLQIGQGDTTVYNNVTVYPMLNHGTTALPFKPYVEDTYQLPQTLDLAEGDSFNPQTGVITRADGTTETLENVPKFYTAWKNGTETIEGNTNEEYGALPTITNIYAVKKGGVNREIDDR